MLHQILSILVYNIPSSTIFVVSAGTEFLTTIGIMASITWQVLIVTIFAMVIVSCKICSGRSFYYIPLTLISYHIFIVVKFV